MKRIYITDVSGAVFVIYFIVGLGALVSLAAPPVAYFGRGKAWAHSLLILFVAFALLPTYGAVSAFVAFVNEGFQLSHLLGSLAWLVPGIVVWWSIHLWRPRETR